MKNIGRLIVDIVMILILSVGLLALIYPFASDAINNFLDEQIVHYHTQQINQQTKAATQKRKIELEKNKKLAEGAGNPGKDPFEKEAHPVKATPDYYQQHTIAVINIPKINVKLPIFDHTNELFLKKGAALLEGTSYPTGGKSTHAVVSAHRGLPEANLFTDLPRLKKKDQFFIVSNGETLAYEVNQIEVVEPTEIETLAIVPNKDYVTLVTCTPYMINSHRLLVRGERIPFKKAMTKMLKKNDQQRQAKFWLTVTSCIVVSVGLLLFLYWRIWNWRISNQKYDLNFCVIDQYGIPKVGLEVTLFTANGKHQITRKGKPIKSFTTIDGNLYIGQLKGGCYRVKVGSLIFKVKIKKVKDKNFYQQKILENPANFFVESVIQNELTEKKIAKKWLANTES